MISLKDRWHEEDTMDVTWDTARKTLHVDVYEDTHEVTNLVSLSKEDAKVLYDFIGDVLNGE